MNVPEKYHAYIEMVVSTARGFLSDGMELESIAFLGKFGVGFIPVPMDMGQKDASAAWIKEICRQTRPDFVMMISEAWSLSKETSEEEFARIAKSRESIVNHPNRQDIVMLTLETQEGFWLSQTPVRLLSDKKREFDDPEFLFATLLEGRFTQFLPPERETH